MLPPSLSAVCVEPRRSIRCVEGALYWPWLRTSASVLCFPCARCATTAARGALACHSLLGGLRGCLALPREPLQALVAPQFGCRNMHHAPPGIVTPGTPRQPNSM
jgi:hypothetical protein